MARLGWALLPALLFGAVACGKSRDTSMSPEAMSGDAGAAGAATAGGTAGAGGRIVLETEPDPCTTSDGQDGLMVDTLPKPPWGPRCEAIDQPGELDSACPSEPFFECGLDHCVGHGELPGCCRADGLCGVWDEGKWSRLHSLGCIDREPWIEEAAWIGSTAQQIDCTP